MPPGKLVEQRLPLERAKVDFAVLREDLGNVLPGSLFDDLVYVDRFPIEPL